MIVAPVLTGSIPTAPPAVRGRDTNEKMSQWCPEDNGCSASIIEGQARESWVSWVYGIPIP